MRVLGLAIVLALSSPLPAFADEYVQGYFRKDGTYYLIAAEGGTAEGHSEVVFRSDRVAGPYVAFDRNPILTQRDIKGPITSTGHASFVKTQNGDWWSVFLGVRPYGDDNFNTGRETFLMPVQWKDGWPRITEPKTQLPWVLKRPNLPAGPKALVPTSGSFTIRDEFNGTKLPLYWMMMRNPVGKWWRLSGGALQLDAQSTSLGDMGNPSLWARRQQHLNATVTTRVRFDPPGDGAEAGVVAMQNDEHWYFLAVGRDHGRRVVRLRRRDNSDVAGEVLATAPLSSASAVDLRIAARGGTYDFSWSSDGKRWHVLQQDADGTVLSTKKAGGFVGAVFALYAHDPEARP